MFARPGDDGIEINAVGDGVSLAVPAVPATPGAAPEDGPAAGADEGFLEVTLTPGGNVSIDGQAPMRVEGTQRFSLKAGSHEVVASDSKVITAWSVVVRPGATVKKQFTFRRPE